MSVQPTLETDEPISSRARPYDLSSAQLLDGIKKCVFFIQVTEVLKIFLSSWHKRELGL